MTELLVSRQDRAVARAVASSAWRRTIPVLRALAANPAGLSTADLARQCHSDVKPWKYALTRVGGLLRHQQAAGRVKLAGTVPSSHHAPVFLWQITGEGESFLREYASSERAGRCRTAAYRTAAEQCRRTARRIALLRRQVRALGSLEEGLAELEQLEREMEALGKPPGYPSR